jgi:hypothetical protein
MRLFLLALLVSLGTAQAVIIEWIEPTIAPAQTNGDSATFTSYMQHLRNFYLGSTDLGTPGTPDAFVPISFAIEEQVILSTRIQDKLWNGIANNTQFPNENGSQMIVWVLYDGEGEKINLYKINVQLAISDSTSTRYDSYMWGGFSNASLAIGINEDLSGTTFLTYPFGQGPLDADKILVGYPYSYASDVMAPNANLQTSINNTKVMIKDPVTITAEFTYNPEPHIVATSSSIDIQIVPEPTSAMTILMGGLLLLSRRRR